MNVEWEKEMLRKKDLLEFYDEKELCVVKNTVSKEEEKTYSMDGNETYINFV